MREEISVLISDDNVEFGNLLNERMSQEADLRVVGIARDGIQAIEMIKNMMPDIVVLDIIMPNLDGIGVLERVAELNLEQKPLFIMLSAIGQDIFIQKAIILGAEYYIVKPFDVSVLISRLRQIQKEKFLSPFTANKVSIKTTPEESNTTEKPIDLEIEVTNLMRDVGIPPHMVGYQFIREAIIQTIGNAKAYSSITKILYPTVARKFGTTPQKVERAIRNAIESAWSRGNTDSIDSLFGYTVNFSKGKPTNSEFIAMMADKIRVSNQKNNE
jgi:two-component system, response regulator, stage 0 sporulation protein A